LQESRWKAGIIILEVRTVFLIVGSPSAHWGGVST
jgi:hypothetical protein